MSDLYYKSADIRRDLAKLLPAIEAGVHASELDETFSAFKDSFPRLYNDLLTDRSQELLDFLEQSIQRMEMIEAGETTKKQQDTVLGQELFDAYGKPLVEKLELDR